MRLFAAPFALVLASGLLLAGCGGGVDIGVVVPPPPPSAAFDVGAKLDGQWLPNVDVYPDDQQTIPVQTGDVLELDASGPVYWEIVAGSSAGIPTQAGGAVTYQGVTFTETISDSGRLKLAISAGQPLVQPVAITVYATSLYDATQTARIDVVVTQ